MKLVLAAIVLSCAVAATTVCVGCDGIDNVQVKTDSTGTGTVSATVDGAASNATGESAVSGARSGSDLSISATYANGGHIGITTTGVTTPGTYSLGVGGQAAATYSLGTALWQSTVPGGSGSLTFTTLTTSRAVGTFSFTGAAVFGTSATGTKAVTGGSFDVTLGVQ